MIMWESRIANLFVTGLFSKGLSSVAYQACIEMMVRSLFLILTGLGMGFSTMGQSETFDIVTYNPPRNWKKEVADFAVSYVMTNNQTRGWCRISVYKSIKSSGDALNDFNSEWNNLISKTYSGTTMPKPESETEDGWTAYSGATTFQFENKEAYALLSTISGYGVEVSLLVLMNNQEFMREVEQTLSSLNLKKPEGQVTSNSSGVENPALPGITVSTAAGSQGISISKTNFDDGWVAQPFADFVKVTKNQITVLLHYGIQITDEMRSSNNVEGVLFDRLILPRYNVSNIRKYDNGGPCYFCIYFYEADGIDKATGMKCHIGFRVITNNGISRCIEIISPSAAVFQQEFSTQEKIEAMLNYNKFAVTAADLIGKWEESTFAGVDMYNVNTGAYAGMNTSSSANSFVFNDDNTYSSNHKGAFGMVGSMQFYDQKYKGKMTVTNWDLTLTNRWEGKTDIFWAQFEAVRGGKILHLRDKSASGITYHLVKVN